MSKFNPFRKPRVTEPVLPEVDEEAVKAEAQEEDRKRRENQRGRASTVLTSRRGVLGDDSTSQGGVATKTLLGG